MPGTLSQHSILIRPANSNDAAAIAQLGSYVFTQTFGYSVPPHELQAYLTQAYSPEAVIKDLQDPVKDILVASTHEGVIVGFAFLTRDSSEPCISHVEKTIELQRLYVHPEHHGKGIGRVLSDRVEDMARRGGFEWIWLGVWEENLKALKVYERLGYGTVGSHDFTIGDVVQTDHIMLKKL